MEYAQWGYVRTSLTQMGTRFLVWIIATASALEAFLEATIAALRGQALDILVWVTGGLLIFGFALFVERVKLQEVP